MQDKKWCIAKSEPHLARELAQVLGISPLIGQLLVNRGIRTASAGALYLTPSLNGLNDPYQISGMEQALDRLDQALHRKEKILVYGDYDTDGITATVLLVNLFRLIDYPVSHYIPHRIEEGYGLNHAALDKFAHSGVQLLITVDCGIVNFAEIDYARKLGIDVIITDHHEPQAELPQAVAVVNPKIGVIGTSTANLAGVGVVFKLVWAFTQRFSPVRKNSKDFHDFLLDAMALTALGTVADVAPLVNENRVLVTYGLEALRHTRLKGLKALLVRCGLDKRLIQADDIAFRVAPRLNAPGRLDSARLSTDLLLTPAEPMIQEIVKELEESNRERQRLESKILGEARDKLLEEFDPEEEFMVVLADKAWHPGVIGIVASRLAEEFYSPVVLIALRDGQGKGSARSIPQFHLYRTLAQCRDLFDSFGGHAAAAGFEIETALIPELKERLNTYLKQSVKREDFVPTLFIDATIPLTEINKKLVKEIERLTPFGAGAPEPLLASAGVRLAGVPRLMGNKEEHLSFYVTQDNLLSHRVVGFKQAELIEEITRTTKSDHPFSIAYTPRINNWRDEESVELYLKDIQFSPTK